MRPPPESLPPPSSPKWHSRRLWDSLGYLRVRTLGKPNWHRGLLWPIRRLRLGMPAGHSLLRQLYDEVLGAATRYPKTRSGVRDADESWDQLLGCVTPSLSPVKLNARNTGSRTCMPVAVQRVIAHGHGRAESSSQVWTEALIVSRNDMGAISAGWRRVFCAMLRRPGYWLMPPCQEHAPC